MAGEWQDHGQNTARAWGVHGKTRQEHDNIMVRQRQTHGKYMASAWIYMARAWQSHDASVARPWQAHGKSMASPWQELGGTLQAHGKIMAQAWQQPGNHMAKAWQEHGNGASGDHPHQPVSTSFLLLHRALENDQLPPLVGFSIPARWPCNAARDFPPPSLASCQRPAHGRHDDPRTLVRRGNP